MSLSNQAKVKIVFSLYAVVVRDICKIPIRVLGIPPAESLTFINAVNFFNLSVSLREPLYDLIAIGLCIYSEEWCKKTFKRIYPPLPVLLTPKTRARICLEIPKYIKTAYKNVITERVALVLNIFDKKTQLALIESGALVGNDLELQKRMKEQMLSKNPLRVGRKKD